MNIFEQYGIKEVADVCLYAIELNENDDEIYIPVLYLDTLKVSTIEKTAEQASARGGLGNPELIIWDYGKEITVNLEDALYTPASMGMLWGGQHGVKKVELDGIINDKKAKAIIDNFSDFSKSSFINIIISEDSTLGITGNYYIWKVSLKVSDIFGLNTEYLKDYFLVYIQNCLNIEYKNLWFLSDTEKTVNINNTLENSNFIMNQTQKISSQEVIYQIEHSLNNVKYIDRIEKCVASHNFVINTDRNLEHSNYRYLEQYSQCELAVFINPQTMQPYETNINSYTKMDGTKITGNLCLIKQYDIYYKWTRTKALENTSLGHQIIVDATHFPGTYRLVGETYSRNRKTGKDERFQFEIPLCKVNSENTITLEAEGEPTTFNMSLKVLRREDGVMMKLTQYSVEDNECGNTKITPINNINPEDIVPPEPDIPDPEIPETEVTWTKVPYGEEYNDWDNATLDLSLNQAEYLIGDTIDSPDTNEEQADNELYTTVTYNVCQDYAFQKTVGGVLVEGVYLTDTEGNMIKDKVIVRTETELVSNLPETTIELLEV